MNIMSRIRIYHAVLASLAIIAYLTGEMGIIHSWLGYGVAIVIVLRLLWALSGDAQVGLKRFAPSFKGLKFDNAFTHPAISRVLMLGVALSLLGVTGTGIAMDRGKAVGLANAEIITTAYADDDEHEGEGAGEREHGGPLKEVHEFFGNLMLALVGVHAAYMLLFRRTLAKFMLFIPRHAHETVPTSRE